MKKISIALIAVFCQNNIDGPLIVRPPVSDEIIEKAELKLAVKLPGEVVDLYKIHNGIGVKSNSGKIYWSFHPLEDLFQFTTSIRDYFSDTHPKEAARFLPIYDWNSGDAVGYLAGPDGKWLDGLYEFSLEDYENDRNQPLSEFLSRSHASLNEFLAE